MKYYFFIPFVCLLNVTVHAEVVFDGTLGQAENLTGPIFYIESKFGQQVGPNLFHSFAKFNVNHDEIAGFFGPETIHNVISRVTGGEISHIDGILYSKIPNADLYFVNPAGVIFGEKAQLHIPGSLYVSTADYLRLGEHGRFDVSQPMNSLLTIAPPTAFGFLDKPVGNIEVNGSFLETPTNKVIGTSLAEGKEVPRNTLALVGGDIKIQDGILKAFWGKIHLVSAASKGEASIDPSAITDDAFAKFGKITINDYTDNPSRKRANIDVSGIGGGEVQIRAEQLSLDNGYIFADTLGNENGQGITIKATDGINLFNAARITTSSPKNFSSGNAGDIHITADKIHISQGSQIDSGTEKNATGNAGNLTITAKERLLIEGTDTSTKLHLSSGIFSNTRSNESSSAGGNIKITAGELVMDDRGEIRAETKGFGKGGNISVQVDNLKIHNGANINTGTGNTDNYLGTGQSGSITVTAKESVLINGYGMIPINGENYLRRSGLMSNTFTAGKGGTIEISTPSLTIQNDGAIQAAARNTGNAGNIELTTTDLLMDNGTITTQAEMAAGGNMTIHTNERLYLLNSIISAEANSDKPQDSGGNLTIDRANFTILDQSKIFTRGFAGNGGNIRIIAEQFIKSTDSELDASSTLGVDGEIYIDSSVEDFIDISILPTRFNKLELKKQFCETTSSREISKFRLAPRSGLLASPNDLQH